MPTIVNGTTGLTFSDGSVQNTAAIGFRNRIINGAMMIDQRNAGASVTPADAAYTVDRWQYGATQASKFTAQQNAGSVTPPTGFKNYLGMTVASAVSVGAGDIFQILQSIEGFNAADLGWGAAGASTVTLSFWVRSSLTGTFGGALTNSAFNRAYPFTYTISAANTWEQKTVTISGDTSGTWLTTNGIGISVRFGLGVGSTYSGTAGSWAATGYVSATGATSVVGTSGATFYITGVQLEKGETASSFDFRSYGTELQLCQRYYQKIGNGGSGNGYQNFAVATSYASGPNTFRFQIYLQTVMRAVPSFSTTGALTTLGVVTGSVTAQVSDGGGNPIVGLELASPSAGSAGQSVIVRGNGDTTAALNFSAEL